MAGGMGLRFFGLCIFKFLSLKFGKIIENAPTQCYRDSRWLTTPNFHEKYRTDTPGSKILDSQNLPPNYPENTKKIPPKYRSFCGISGIFLQIRPLKSMIRTLKMAAIPYVTDPYPHLDWSKKKPLPQKIHHLDSRQLSDKLIPRRCALQTQPENFADV